jgi:hypothetical protein
MFLAHLPAARRLPHFSISVFSISAFLFSFSRNRRLEGGAADGGHGGDEARVLGVVFVGSDNGAAGSGKFG